MVFHSDLFDTHPTFILLKSILLDFYNGHALPALPLASVEHVISITAGPLPAAPEPTSTNPTPTQPMPKVHFRVYTVALLPAPSSAPPRITLTEMGPSIDLTVRRIQEPDEDMMKQAMKRPKMEKRTMQSGLGKKRKNIETDEMGDRVGQLHFKKQDLKGMQGRKMKGLKPGMENRGRRSQIVLPGAKEDGAGGTDE
jgi:ribosome production factor 2